MRVLIQKVSKASVTINLIEQSKIEQGLLVFIGIENSDTETQINWIANKIINLRIFNDEQGLMNKNVLDINGSILLVSQFTLYGDAQKGNRPSFVAAAKPNIAIPIYEKMISSLSTLIGHNIATGVFGADMKVMLINDGPVTIWLEK